MPVLRRVFIGDGGEADPCEQALRKAVVFGHADQGFGDGAGEYPEIACVCDDIHSRRPSQDAVEAFGEFGGKPALGAPACDCSDAVGVGGCLEHVEHVRHVACRLLQVDVDEAAVASLRLLKAREHGGFLTEIAREAHGGDVANRFADADGFLHALVGSVAAAVVDEDDFKRSLDARHQIFQDHAAEGLDILRLVESWGYEREFVFHARGLPFQGPFLRNHASANSTTLIRSGFPCSCDEGWP